MQPEETHHESAYLAMAALACIAACLLYIGYLTRVPEKITVTYKVPKPPTLGWTSDQAWYPMNAAIACTVGAHALDPQVAYGVDSSGSVMCQYESPPSSPIATYPMIPTTLTGTWAPTGSLGRNGDYYIDLSTGSIYGPKKDGVWPRMPVKITAQ